MAIVKEFLAVIIDNLFGLIVAVLVFLYMDVKTDDMAIRITELKAALERCEKE